MSKNAVKKFEGIIKVDNVIALAAQLASFQNQIMTPFNKLSANQSQAQVNIVQ